MFGSSGIVASTLPLSAFEVCLMRLIIGALFMGLIFVVPRQQLPRHIGRRQYLFVALSGACLGLAMMTIFTAYRLLGVGLGAVLAATLIAVGSSICGGSAIAATAPVITMALSPLLFKEHLRLPVVVGFAIVVGGLLLLNASALEGTLSVPGILMGLAAAASTASSPSPIARPFFGMAFSPVCWNTVSIPQPPRFVMVDENRRRRPSNFSPGEADICREIWYTGTRIDKPLTAAGGVGAGPRED